MEFFTFPGTLQLIESFLIVLLIRHVTSYYNGQEVEPGAAAVHSQQEV